MKYRKKPVIIEARQITQETFWDVYHWIGDDVDEWSWGESSERYIIIRTLEGNHKAQENDFVIQGVKGEFYPCKPAIFELTYEVVNES